MSTRTALAAVGLAAVVALLWRRRRRWSLSSRRCSELPPAARAGERAFEAHARATAADPRQCVLQCASARGMMNLWQGSFGLIERDLVLTLGRDAAVHTLTALRAAGVPDAFALRRELVNVKKVIDARVEPAPLASPQP
jgi:hypothetical protein